MTFYTELSTWLVTNSVYVFNNREFLHLSLYQQFDICLDEREYGCKTFTCLILFVRCRLSIDIVGRRMIRPQTNKKNTRHILIFTLNFLCSYDQTKVVQFFLVIVLQQLYFSLVHAIQAFYNFSSLKVS